jgi:hypothetical protein
LTSFRSIGSRSEQGIKDPAAPFGQIGRKGVVDEIPATFRLDEPGVFQDPQMLGNRPCRDTQQMGQSPHAKRPSREELDDLDALLDGQRPEHPRRILSILSDHVF